MWTCGCCGNQVTVDARWETALRCDNCGEPIDKPPEPSVWERLNNWVNTPDPSPGFYGRLVTIDDMQVILRNGLMRIMGFACPENAGVLVNRPDVVVAGTDENPASLEAVVDACLRKWVTLHGGI